jgi:hypothetical protein
VAELKDGHNDVMLLELPDEFFAEADTPAQFQCTPLMRSEFARVHGKLKGRKICEYSNYAYYRATDEALLSVVRDCPTCTHVLVTNGDNGYAPTFLHETLKHKEELVITDFAHEGDMKVGELELGDLDLGGVLFRKSVLRGGQHTFLSSLPPGATAMEVHNADFWFAKKAVQDGASFTVVHKLLFYHH